MTSCQTDYAFIWNKVFKNGPSKICGRQPSILEYLVQFQIPECETFDLLQAVVNQSDSSIERSIA